MFWKFNFPNASSIDTLLQKENVTLQELMDQDDIVQECQGRNTNLVDFLVRPDNLEALVDYISKEPSDELDDNAKYKYSNVACELLTCDVPIINETLAGSPNLLGKLCSFIEKDPPLNPLMASFFSKAMITMVTRKTDENWFSYQFACLQVFDFIKTRVDFVPLLVRHIGTSAIMDLVLKLMVYVEGPELRQAFTSWLCDQKLIERLVTCFDVGVEKERHVHVSLLLCDMIGVCRGDLSVTKCLPGPLPNLGLNGVNGQRGGDTENASSFVFLKELESKEMLSLMLNHMLGGRERSETAVFYGLNVILSLMDIQNSCVVIPDEDSGHVSDRGDSSSPPGDVKTEKMDLDDDNVAGASSPPGDASQASSSSPPSSSTAMWRLHPCVRNVVEVLTPWFADLHHILLNPPARKAMGMTFGVLEPPLGAVRLQIARLVAALVSLKYRPISEKLAELGTLQVLVDLFFKYSWNNFLHSLVESIVATLLSTPNGAVTAAARVDPKIIEIMAAGVQRKTDDSPDDSDGGSAPSSPSKDGVGDAPGTEAETEEDVMLGPKDMEIFDPLLVHLLFDIEILAVIVRNWSRGEEKTTGYMGHLGRMVSIFAERREASSDGSQRLLAVLIKNAEARLSDEERSTWLELVSRVVPELRQMCFSVLPDPNEFDGMKSVDADEAACGDSDLMKAASCSSEVAFHPQIPDVDEGVRRVILALEKDIAKARGSDEEDESFVEDEEEVEDARRQFEAMCSTRISGLDEEEGEGSGAERISVKALDLAQQEDAIFGSGSVSSDFELVASLSEGQEDLSVAVVDPWSSIGADSGQGVQDGWADFSSAFVPASQAEQPADGWGFGAQTVVFSAMDSAHGEAVAETGDGDSDGDAAVSPLHPRTWAQVAAGSAGSPVVVAITAAEGHQLPSSAEGAQTLIANESVEEASAPTLVGGQPQLEQHQQTTTSNNSASSSLPSAEQGQADA